MNNQDKLPTVSQYTSFLSEAAKRFNLTINECRDRYGTYTIGEWQKLLSEEKPKISMKRKLEINFEFDLSNHDLDEEQMEDLERQALNSIYYQLSIGNGCGELEVCPDLYNGGDIYGWWDSTNPRELKDDEVEGFDDNMEYVKEMHS